jgi:hypothetical protein
MAVKVQICRSSVRAILSTVTVRKSVVIDRNYKYRLQNIDRALICRFAGLSLESSRLRAMRSKFCGLSRSSTVDSRLGTNVDQQLYAPEATLGRLVRTYECLILVQEVRHCKPEGAE